MSRLVPSAFPFAAPRGGSADVLIIAGEHSGDEQAARMVARLLERQPQVRVVAIGGRRLATVGAQLLFDLTATSVVGFVEVLRHFGHFRRVFHETLRWIDVYRPRVVCFVDYPGFNLRLARALADRRISHAGGGPVRAVYYISPQIWAWKARRRFAMARVLDALAVIFPFEIASYADTELPVRFVGHPFVAGDFALPLAYAPKGPVLLLPGSRVAPVRRIAPLLLDAFAVYRRQQPDARAVMIHPSQLVRQELARELAHRPLVAGAVTLVANDAPVAAGAVLTSSGTMSLVCALAGIPGAIAYRINPLSYQFARRVVRVPYIGIANLLLPEPIYPEFIQRAATPAALAAEVADSVDNPDRVERTRRLAEQLRHALAQPPQGDAGAWLAEQLEQSKMKGT